MINCHHWLQQTQNGRNSQQYKLIDSLKKKVQTFNVKSRNFSLLTQLRILSSQGHVHIPPNILKKTQMQKCMGHSKSSQTQNQTSKKIIRNKTPCQIKTVTHTSKFCKCKQYGSHIGCVLTGNTATTACLTLSFELKNFNYFLNL
jgi:hypothetical protein